MTEQQSIHGSENPVTGAPPDVQNTSKMISPASHLPPTAPLSPPISSPLHPPVGGGIPSRLRSRSMDQQSMAGPLSPVASRQPRSVPTSPITGKRFSPHPPVPSGMAMMGFADLIPMPHPPEPSERQRVMESAVASERKRAKELETEEAKMTADELRAVLKTERRRTAQIMADLAVFKLSAVEFQSEAEVLEEGRINGLMRRVDQLQQEKGRIMLDLEREEEMLTNTLQKQLNEVRREKARLEQQIDREKKSNSTLENHLTSLKDSNSSITSTPLMTQVLEEDEEEEDDNEEEEQTEDPDSNTLEER